jgi:hypothetical protein
LLHLPVAELPDAVRHLVDALRPGGILFMSFKEGRGEEIDKDGRHFTYLNELELLQLAEKAGLDVLETRISGDAVAGRTETRRWLSLIARRPD